MRKLILILICVAIGGCSSFSEMTSYFDCDKNPDNDYCKNYDPEAKRKRGESTMTPDQSLDAYFKRKTGMSS